MTYGDEAVIPLESGFPTTRTSSFNPKDNDENLERGLDLIDEKRGKRDGSIGPLSTEAEARL